MSVIIYGPKGSGKTHYAEELRRHFGMKKIIDDWAPGDPLVSMGLHLTNIEPKVQDAIHIETALAELRKRDDILTSRALQSILNERERQRRSYPVYSDDDMNAFDWYEMISDYNAWARRKAVQGNTQATREMYVKVAALAVAAVEAIDRKTGETS